MLIDPLMAGPRTKRFPFDRVGVLALVWAVLFVAVAAGVAFLLG